MKTIIQQPASFSRINAYTDFEVHSPDTTEIQNHVQQIPGWYNLTYFFTGALFTVLLMKTEIVSWYRVQEMFRLQSFHLYGVLGSAVLTGALSVFLIKKFSGKTIYGQPVKLYPKKFHKGQVYGGLLFGAGWALTGACPGPLFIQAGAGASVVAVTLLAALAGTWAYGLLQNKLPH